MGTTTAATTVTTDNDSNFDIRFCGWVGGSDAAQVHRQRLHSLGRPITSHEPNCSIYRPFPDPLLLHCVIFCFGAEVCVCFGTEVVFCAVCLSVFCGRSCLVKLSSMLYAILCSAADVVLLNCLLCCMPFCVLRQKLSCYLSVFWG